MRPVRLWRLGVALVPALLAVPAAGAPPPGSEPPPVSPGTVVVAVLVFVVVPSGLFGGLAAGLGRVLATASHSSRLNAHVPSLLATLGVALVAAGLVAGTPSVLGGRLPWVGVGSGYLALAGLLAHTSGQERSRRFCLAGASLAVLVAVAVTGLQATVTGMLTRATTTRVVYVLALFALFPVGYAAARGEHETAVGLAALGFGVPAASLTAVSVPGFGPGLLLLLALGYYGVVLLLVGTPLLVAGASLTGEKANTS